MHIKLLKYILDKHKSYKTLIKEKIEYLNVCAWIVLIRSENFSRTLLTSRSNASLSRRLVYQAATQKTSGKIILPMSIFIIILRARSFINNWPFIASLPPLPCLAFCTQSQTHLLSLPLPCLRDIWACLKLSNDYRKICEWLNPGFLIQFDLERN